MTGMIINDKYVYSDLIRQRKKLGHDRYDEVWDGVYVMPTLPTLTHQKLVHDLDSVFDDVVVKAGKGEVYPGANVSDRPKNWKRNYRCPDVVVVLNEGQAVNCDAFILGGPDFLVEIRSPREDPNKKLPFYSKIRVRELLILDRDSRTPKLLRHNGDELVPVEPTSAAGEKWLFSEVLPLAFRRGGTKAKPKLEIKRTDGVPGRWAV
jgi:Uma2 family endonuclease